LARSSALPAIAGATWYEWQLRLLKGQLGGHQIDILTTLTRLGSPSNIHGNRKANQRAIAPAKWPLSGGPKASANRGQLDSPTPTNVEANRTLLAGEIGPRWYTAYDDYLATPCRRFSQRIRPRNQGTRHHLPALQKHTKGRRYLQDRPGKRPGMRTQNSRDKSRQSIELIGAPIARDPIPNDGVNVLHLRDTK